MTTVEFEPPSLGADHGADRLEQRRALASFLRARRARLRPEDVGIDPGPRRRIPGLRRQEMAALAGVSVTWYTWLEQARPINVSADVIDALCRALRLDELEWLHVRRLVGLPAPFIERRSTETSSIRSLLEAFGDVPAVAVDSRFDIVYSNASARCLQHALFGDPDLLPRDRRNILWWMFGEPGSRRLIVPWEEMAGLMVGWFRGECGENPGDPRASELVTALSRRSSSFRDCWERAEVKRFGGCRYTVRDPRWGHLVLEANLLRTDQPGVNIVVSMPVDDGADSPPLEQLDHRSEVF
jgi:transcriptional regulator with XRE-family HTH domain